MTAAHAVSRTGALATYRIPLANVAAQPICSTGCNGRPQREPARPVGFAGEVVGQWCECNKQSTVD